MPNSQQFAQKVQVSLVFSYPALSFFGNGSTVAVLVMLFLLSIFLIISKAREPIGMTKWLVITMAIVVPLSIPNVILDGGRMAALDVPSRYLVGAIALYGLAWKKVKLETFFYGLLFGVLVGFLVYPVYLGMILDWTRYRGLFLGEPVKILYIAYIAMAYMALLSAFAYHFCEQKNVKFTVLSFIGAFMAFVIGFMSGSKVVLLGSPILLISGVLVLLKSSKKVKLSGLLALFVLTPLLVIGFTQSDIYERATVDAQNLSEGDIAKSSTGQRIEMLKSAWYSFSASPIIGQGYNQRLEFEKELKAQGRIKHITGGGGKGSLHNEIANTAAKKGIVGLIFIFLLYLVPVVFAYKQWQGNPENKVVFLLMSAFILSYALIGITEAPLMGTATSSHFVIGVVIIALLARQTGACKDGYEEKAL